MIVVKLGEGQGRVAKQVGMFTDNTLSITDQAWNLSVAFTNTNIPQEEYLQQFRSSNKGMNSHPPKVP